MTLDVRDLGRRFGTKVALESVSLEVQAGEVHGFVGVNGAGKSTTMRLIAGLLTPDRGTITWRGISPDERQRRRFALMPEQRGLYPRMRVADQLEYFARLRGMQRRDAQAAVSYWLDRLELGSAAREELQVLSHGNQQRTQLAAVLVARPEVLLLDEPFSGLDVMGVQLLSEILLEVARDGAAVLLSSHQLELVESLCTRVTIINRGRTIVSAGIGDGRAWGPTTVDIVVATDSSAWIDDVAGVEVIRRDGGSVRLQLAEGIDSNEVLDAARQAGPVLRFSVAEVQLNELLTDIVNGHAPASLALEIVA
jgi:ABC-2 type transport system ATP-binding protein